MSAAEQLAAEVGIQLIRRVTMLMHLSAESRCVLLRRHRVDPVIGHRTEETAECPGSKREQSDAAAEAAGGLGSV